MKSIRISDDVYELAQQEAAMMRRSIAQQVEHWAGLGAARGVQRVTVRWPSGRRQEFRDLAGGQGYRLTEGVDTAEVR